MATVKNVDRLNMKLNHLKAIDVESIVKNAVTFVQGQAKELAPKDTGRLAASIKLEVKHEGNTIVGRVFTNNDYAAFVEFGTGRVGNGTYPKASELGLSYTNKPWVYTPDDGEHFYTTEGQVAKPYLYPAMRQNKKQLMEIFTTGIKKENRKKVGGK